MSELILNGNGVAATPPMSIEQAKAAISWWNNNKRHGSIEPKNVRDAREVLKNVDPDDKWIHKILPDGKLEDEKPSGKTQIELTKPITEIGLDDIQFELDRISELAKQADNNGKKRLAYLRGALYNKRWQLNKNAKQDRQFNIQRDLSDIPQESTTTEPVLEVETLQEFEPEIIAIPQIPQSTPTKVCQIKKIFSAIATFHLPEITVEVHDSSNTEEAIIQSLLRQVEAIARKELGI